MTNSLIQILDMAGTMVVQSVMRSINIGQNVVTVTMWHPRHPAIKDTIYSIVQNAIIRREHRQLAGSIRPMEA